MGNTVIQLRNDTAANWTTNNPVLAQGEMGLETDTNKIKFGDGTTAWNSLSYAGGGGSSNRKLLRTTMSGTQTFPTAAYTLVAFDMVATDVYSAYDNTAGNYKFTAPSAGVYFVQALVQYASNATGTRICSMYVNGTSVTQQGYASHGATYTCASWFLTLNAGDYVQIYGYQNSGGNLAINNAADMIFEIYGT